MPLLPTSEALVAPQGRRGSRPSREPVSERIRAAQKKRWAPYRKAKAVSGR
jgi:hypothetical protein